MQGWQPETCYVCNCVKINVALLATLMSFIDTGAGKRRNTFCTPFRKDSVHWDSHSIYDLLFLVVFFFFVKHVILLFFPNALRSDRVRKFAFLKLRVGLFFSRSLCSLSSLFYRRHTAFTYVPYTHMRISSIYFIIWDCLWF